MATQRVLGAKGCERSIIGGKRRDRCRQGCAEKAIAWLDEVDPMVNEWPLADCIMMCRKTSSGEMASGQALRPSAGAFGKSRSRLHRARRHFAVPYRLAVTSWLVAKHEPSSLRVRFMLELQMIGVPGYLRTGRCGKADTSCGGRGVRRSSGFCQLVTGVVPSFGSTISNSSGGYK